MTDVVSSDGTRIGYEVAGTGPALILVDGAMCFRGSGPMRPLAAALAGDVTVLTYDRRGRGASGDTAPYAVDREIDDLQALVEVLGGRAALFGMSSGGALAVLAAARLGAAVTALVVFEPPYMPAPARPAAATYTAQLTAALVQGDLDGAVAAFLARVGTPQHAIDGMRQSSGWVGMRALAPTLGYDDAVMADSAVPSVASGIAAPVTALAGGASPDFLRWGARTLAETIPGAAYRELAELGHDADPTALAAAIRESID